nr:hypothetical protein [Tanacetum cinerariifolium]
MVSHTLCHPSSLRAPKKNRNRESIKRNVTLETTNALLWWLKIDLDMIGMTRPKMDLQTLHLWPIHLQVLQVLQTQTLSLGYHAVPPPYTGNFMPPKPNLILADMDESVISESVTSVPAVATNEAKTSESEPKSVSEPLIEDWVSDNKDENETESKSKQRKPSFTKIEFVKPNEQMKSPRESVKQEEHKKQTQDPLLSSSSKDSPGDGFKPSNKEEKKDVEDPGNEDNKDIVYGCADDLNMSNLEEIVYSDDDEDVGAEADMTNLDTNILVSPIPTTRIHKDHPVEQINRDIHLAPLTRKITKNVTNHEPKKGYTQEEGIDYDEVFVPVARIEAIRLFLAYASFKDFIVYQMDMKSAFLYGKIEEEVYVCQPPGFEDLEFPDRVYKVEKALYGLQQDPRSWYETLSTYLLDNRFHRGNEICTEFKKMMHKKFQMSSMGELTFFLGLQTSKPLMKDENADDVDVHLYRSMIGSLMYLTSSRPDIMFVVCACARFQVIPKVSHVHVVKRIFRYMKGQPKLGLWYAKDSPFDLEAYTDIKNLVFHSKAKYIEIRHHFIRDSYEKRLIQVIKIHTNHNVVDLLTKAFDVSRFHYLIASIGMLNLR